MIADHTERRQWGHSGSADIKQPTLLRAPIEFGDFEEVHYFEAFRYRTVQVQDLRMIRVIFEELEETVLPDPVDVEVYKFDSINITDNSEWYG